MDWTGLVKHGLVKRGLVKRGLVKHGLVKHGLAKHGLAKRQQAAKVLLTTQMIELIRRFEHRPFVGNSIHWLRIETCKTCSMTFV